MKPVNFLIICVFIVFVNLSCNDGSLDNIKAKCSDFELVLERKKSVYKIGGDILFELYFSNIGDKTITLPPIFPVTQMISPPQIKVWSAEQKFNIETLDESLNYEEVIVIEPDSIITLMKINLKNVEGIIWRKQNNWEQESGNIGNVLVKGIYFASASFIPAAQQFGSFTDTLTFTIE